MRADADAPGVDRVPVAGGQSARPGLTQYILSQQELPDVERARLRLLQENYDQISDAQLEAIGVGEGWHCLDVGAGGGSVTLMLADRVGRTGSVVAVDLDTSLLEPIAGDRIEVRRHDVLAEPLPEGAFDLVHARLLLMHVPSRVDAIRRLVRAARPGGMLAVMDPDFTTVALAPTNQIWQRNWSLLIDVLVAGGWDPGYGARLCSDLEAVGLVDVHARYDLKRAPGGSLAARLLSLTFERLRARMIVLGADHEEIDETRRLLEDPANIVSSPTTCIAQGRRVAP